MRVLFQMIAVGVKTWTMSKSRHLDLVNNFDTCNHNKHNDYRRYVLLGSISLAVLYAPYSSALQLSYLTKLFVCLFTV